MIISQTLEACNGWYFLWFIKSHCPSLCLLENPRPDNTDLISRHIETVKAVKCPCFTGDTALALEPSLSQQTGGNCFRSTSFTSFSTGSQWFLKIHFWCPLYYSKRKHHSPPHRSHNKKYMRALHTLLHCFHFQFNRNLWIFTATKKERLMVYSWVIMLRFTNIYLFKIVQLAGPHM